MNPSFLQPSAVSVEIDIAPCAIQNTGHQQHANKQTLLMLTLAPLKSCPVGRHSDHALVQAFTLPTQCARPVKGTAQIGWLNHILRQVVSEGHVGELHPHASYLVGALEKHTLAFELAAAFCSC